jgi:hypothetical protein
MRAKVVTTHYFVKRKADDGSNCADGLVKLERPVKLKRRAEAGRLVKRRESLG